ncbi:hypothetical protein MUO69_07530 [Candidatus Bathyarchaeota archaeon]|nr:hypothetical protein [Candidatus Bathyarchaeota archaeon]
MKNELILHLCLLASYFSAYPVVGKAEAKRTVSVFALYLVIVENQLVQNVPGFLLILILPILIIAILVTAVILGKNTGSNSTRI